MNATADRVNQLLAAGQSREAIDLCRHACQAPGATPGEWALYGRLCADAGDLPAARKALMNATTLDPGLVAAQFGLGKVLATAGEYAAAIDRLHKAAHLQAGNAEIWLALGITCGLAGQPAAAETHCRRALELKPGSAAAHFNLANALQAQGRLVEAEAEYEAALGIEPTMAGGWSMLAQARLGLHKFDDAEAAASEALRLAPRTGEAHFTLGNLLDARGEKERALDHFHRAVELLPGFPDARLRLAQIQFDLKDFANAAESLQGLLSLNPNLSQVHFYLGECFRERKLPGRAENCYRRVLALNNDHLLAHYRLAFLLQGMDRHQESATHFAEVLRLNPDDAQARHLLAAQRGETTANAPASYVARLFDKFSDTFDTKLVEELDYRTPGLLCDMLRECTAPGPATLDVLDLGCGTGLCGPLFRPVARTLHGVDLSPRMIEKARARAGYDTLEVDDAVSSLQARANAWDLVISSDVFVYVGDLQDVFDACRSALRPGGLFAFSVEDGDDVETFVLRGTGRYAHASAYIRALAATHGFAEIRHRTVGLRKEKGEYLNGHLFLLRKSMDFL